MPKTKVALGEVLIASKATGRMLKDKRFAKFVHDCLKRHARGDSGDLTLADMEKSAQGIMEGRIFSAYKYREQKLWIVTEADHSTTVVLLP